MPNRKTPAEGAKKARSVCPIANALEIVGDRWTLIVIRDLMFLGKAQFNEFLSSPEGITTNILADRLRRLERAGIVARAPYQERPRRYAYRLTEKGRELKPLLVEMIHWGNRHIPGTAVPPRSLLGD